MPEGAPRRLFLATGNRHKLTEFRALLGPLGYHVEGPPQPLHVEEDGATFAENAVKKATALCALTRAPALADDSGLEVEALGGAPGVRSARFAADHGVAPPGDAAAQDAANRQQLLRALRGVTQRQARFVCAIAYCSPQAAPQLFEGTVDGSIALQEAGSAGFGYDALFVPSGRRHSFAELGAAEKHRMSHRGRAVQRLCRALGMAPP